MSSVYLAQERTSLKQRLVSKGTPSKGKQNPEGVFRSVANNRRDLGICISAIFVLLGLSLTPAICAGETNQIGQDHNQFYRSGSVLDINGVLGLSSLEKGSVKEVTVKYNMAFSSLQADWLHNGEVVGHTSMPRGLNKSIRLTYNWTLPGTISLRFTGAKGQVQLVRVSAVIGEQAIGAYQFEEMGMSSEEKSELLSRMIKVGPASDKKNTELALEVKEQFIKTIIDKGLMDDGAIRSNISENNFITVQVDKGKASISGRINGSQGEKVVINSLRSAAGEIKGVKSIATDFTVIEPVLFQILPFVPSVVGQSRQDAEEIIESAGFQLKVENLTSYEDRHRGNEGMVISQSPEGGTQSPEGSEITVTVYNPTSLTNFPDFVVTEITLNPVDLKAYDQVTFSAKIKNIGQQADRPSCLAIRIGGTCEVGECSTQVLTPLAPGEERTVELNKLYQCTIYPGESLLTAKIDSNNVVRENNENNNSLSKEIDLPTVTPQQGVLDLYIDRIRSTNGTTGVSELEQGEYELSILNPYYSMNEISPIPDVRLKGITENGVDEHVVNFTMDGNETTVLFRFPRHFSALGKHYIKFTVDFGDRVDEKNERNNSAWTYVQVMKQTPMPDMIVTDIMMDPPSPKLFDNVRVGVKIKNIGNTDSMPGCFAVYLRGNRVGHCSGPVLQTLPAGQEGTYWVPNTYPLTFMLSGENTLTADADDLNGVFESNERNNRFTRTVNVPAYQPGPNDIDLSIDRIRITNSQGSVEEGELPEFDVYVQNHFYALNHNAAIHNIRLAGVSEDGQHRVETTFTMDAHEKKVPVKFPTPLDTEGNHYFRFSVDVGNSVQEFNETNNDRWGVIRRMQKYVLPDNTITEIFLDPELPQAFDQVRVGVNVKNVGTKTAASIGCYEASVGDCKVNYCSGGTSQALEKGEERVIWNSGRQFCAVFPGEINVSAKIDTYNKVWESDETNNVMSKKISVSTPPSGPDLMVSGIRVMHYVYVGSRANIEVTVRNNTYVFGGQNPNIANVELEISTPDGLSQTAVFDMDSHEKKIILTFAEPFAEVDIRGFDIVARVDTANSVDEINESNNRTLGWMQVIPAP